MVSIVYWSDIKDKGVCVLDKGTHWTAITRDGVERTVYWLMNETDEAQTWLKKHTTNPVD